MKTLEQKEWIAVTIAVLVVGFFFVFGQMFMDLFTNNSNKKVSQQNNSEVLIEDTTVGTGDLAESGDRVVVHYTGRFIDGTVFDSSVTRGEPFQFVLGVGQVIKGWDIGVEGMRVGGKRILSIPPEFGYGPNDYGPIPGGSTLIFEVELLKVER
jgi:FKBP-type peptidyl-prolyl cis-trans isomerase